MCGRITQKSNLHQIAEEFAADPSPAIGWEPIYNITPGMNVVAVRLVDGKRELARFQWQLVPSWSPTRKTTYSTFLARAERVRTAPAFRSAYQHRRCLVVADFYHEWEGPKKARLPTRYQVDGGKPFALAGLWERWDKEGEPLESCAVIVTEANALASKVHDRMPVILDERDYDGWLRGDEIPLIPFPPERMEAFENTTWLNDPRHQGPECIGPRSPQKSLLPKDG
ncbi:SOS response-associated peptidase [Anatilimnocola sp. NA78]|uniref:SOS response-associated peptidase n=1 Tax=Anatilimnocola sp. NA78 TaxID=3415683 RepID=UPI003CE53A90